ncbi:hypothetical protein A5740_20080 [Mycobacterium sp. GA-1841]|uniref:hypothetical protein n=1 Tax=Mycobacterium sp. GA-1841 TaxID=1834154 RepID=UPI00096DE4A0|nr:hypothetical protein [Mycobacterium sp. GA-1841]OMC27882.1 hypothetical protein A5740_20080 [Mycobacterium sp. GA-1841]
MSRFSRIRDLLKNVAMTCFVRFLRLIVVIAEWWPAAPAPSRSVHSDDQRGGSMGSVGPP